MNVDQLQRKLVEAARAQGPSEQVPYGFEQRILARLRSGPVPDVWALWARGLWRAAAPCVAITLLLCAWSFLSPSSASSNTDLTQAFENTVLAAADQEQPPADFQR